MFYCFEAFSYMYYGPALSPYLLYKVDFAHLLAYIQSLTTASDNELFGSVVGALVLCRGSPGSIPARAQEYFQLCFTIVMAIMLSCCKMGAHPGLDIILAKKAFRHRFLEEGECYGPALLPFIYIHKVDFA